MDLSFKSGHNLNIFIYPHITLMYKGQRVKCLLFFPPSINSCKEEKCRAWLWKRINTATCWDENIRWTFIRHIKQCFLIFLIFAKLYCLRHTVINSNMFRYHNDFTSILYHTNALCYPSNPTPFLWKHKRPIDQWKKESVNSNNSDLQMTTD